LDHDPVFGPDVDDVAAAKGRLDELIDACLERAGGLVGAKAQRDELVAEALRRETRSSLVRAKDLFGLTNSEVADLFGVDRQVVDQWGECGEISDNVREKLASLLLVGDLLSRRLAPGRLPIVARRRADAYGGITMLDMVATGRGTELCELTEPVFDWAGTS
jgi:hypothetical protein